MLNPERDKFQGFLQEYAFVEDHIPYHKEELQKNREKDEHRGVTELDLDNATFEI